MPCCRVIRPQRGSERWIGIATPSSSPLAAHDVSSSWVPHAAPHRLLHYPGRRRQRCHAGMPPTYPRPPQTSSISLHRPRPSASPATITPATAVSQHPLPLQPTPTSSRRSMAARSQGTWLNLPQGISRIVQKKKVQSSSHLFI